MWRFPGGGSGAAFAADDPLATSGPPSILPEQQVVPEAAMDDRQLLNAETDADASGREEYLRSSRDEFWQALSGHYDYLMDEQLITACREVEADFATKCSQSSPQLLPDEGMSSLESSLPSLTGPGGVGASGAGGRGPPELTTVLHASLPQPPLQLMTASCTGVPHFVQGGQVGLTPQQLVERLGELKGWLLEIETKLRLETDPERSRRILRWIQQELSTYRECKDRLLREAQIVSSSSAPIAAELKSQVSAGAEETTNLWSTMQNACMMPQENLEHVDKDELFHGVTTDMRSLRRWLRDQELRLPAPKNVPVYWTLHDLKTKLNNQKTIQREIESKGHLVKSLLRRCEQLVTLERQDASAVVNDGEHHEQPPNLGANAFPAAAAATAAAGALPPPEQRQPPAPTPATASAPRSSVVAGARRSVSRSRIGLDVSRIYRLVANLERRWHTLWLRSLEWQCLVEQLLGVQQRAAGSGRDAAYLDGATSSVSSGDTWDEPLSKQPRLDLTLTLCPTLADELRVSSGTVRPTHGHGGRPADKMEIQSPLAVVPGDLSVDGCLVPRPPDNKPALQRQSRECEKGCKHKRPQLPQELSVVPVAENSAQQTNFIGSSSGNYEGVQDVGYSSESSGQLSGEEKTESANLMYLFAHASGSSADTTPESPSEMPSRDSGLSAGGSPRKYPLSAKCLPIDDVDDNEQVLKDVIDEDYISKPTKRASGSASDFYKLTAATGDSDAELTRSADFLTAADGATQQEGAAIGSVADSSGSVLPVVDMDAASVTIDDQIVRLRRKPAVPRRFAPLELSGGVVGGSGASSSPLVGAREVAAVTAAVAAGAGSDTAASVRDSSGAGGVVGLSAAGVGCTSAKAERIQEWLHACELRAAADATAPAAAGGDGSAHQRSSKERVREANAPMEDIQSILALEKEQDSCDASGELTNESSAASGSDDEHGATAGDSRQRSTTTLNGGSAETLLTVGSGATRCPPNVDLRDSTALPRAPHGASQLNGRGSRVSSGSGGAGGGRKRRSQDRPCSVTDLSSAASQATLASSTAANGSPDGCANDADERKEPVVGRLPPSGMSRSFTFASSSAAMTCSVVSTMSAGYNDPAVEGRRRHGHRSAGNNGSSRAAGGLAKHSAAARSATKASVHSGSESDASDCGPVAGPYVSTGGARAGGGAKRGSSSTTTSLVNLCEPTIHNVAREHRRQRSRGSRLALTKGSHGSADVNNRSGHSSSAEPLRSLLKEYSSDHDHKSESEVLADAGADRKLEPSDDLSYGGGLGGDQGSVISSSDNMWDDYQDPPYVSEHYSEKEMDEETMRRLLNFGDDYRSFIGSTSDTSSLSGLRVRGRKCQAQSQSVLRRHGVSKSHDSELESDKEVHLESHLVHEAPMAGRKEPSHDSEMQVEGSVEVQSLDTHQNSRKDDGVLTEPKTLVEQLENISATPLSDLAGNATTDSTCDAVAVAEMLESSNRALASASDTLSKHLSSHEDNNVSSDRLSDLIATCQSNLQWLQFIKIIISIGPMNDVHQGTDQAVPQRETAPAAEQLLLQLIERWQQLLANLTLRAAAGDMVRPDVGRNENDDGSYYKLSSAMSAPPFQEPGLITPCTRGVRGGLVTLEAVSEDVTKLREKMQEMENQLDLLSADSYSTSATSSLTRSEAINERVSRVKTILSSLHELKSSLLGVKIKVHRLAAADVSQGSSNVLESGVPSLTQNIRDLYATWDSLYERLNELHQCHQPVQGESSAARFGFSQKLFERAQAFGKDSIQALGDTNGLLDPNDILKISAQLKGSDGARSVADLPLLSPVSALILGSGIKAKNALTPNKSDKYDSKTIAKSEDDYDSTYESGEESSPAAPDENGADNGGIWRIFKAALPFQVALVMLYCVACFMEPRCCDMSNTLNTFGPQLRYEQGPPPV